MALETRLVGKPRKTLASEKCAGLLLCYICAEGEAYQEGAVRYVYGP